MADEEKALVHKVVDEAGLEEATTHGWQLKTVLTETGIDRCYDDVPHPNPGAQPNGGYNQDTMQLERAFEFRKCKFLLAKTTDNIITELQTQLAEGKKEVEVAEKAADVAENALEAAQTTEVDLRKHLAAREKDVVESGKVAKTAVQLKERSERMLDTVRLEIGTQEMKRILAAAEEDDGQSLEDLLQQATPGA